MPKETVLLSAALESARQSIGHQWEDCLLRRRYHFPACGSERDLAARIDHGEVGCFFPLGTSNAEKAATKAQHIYQLAVKQGWTAVYQQFSRELIVSFEWSINPLLWTYTTIHTLVGGQTAMDAGSIAGDNDRQRVLVVESDDGIRRALCWSINQQAPFVSVPCTSVEAASLALGRYKPFLVLLNRNLAYRLGFVSPGRLAALQPGVMALTYSTHVDGDQMFDSTPAGLEGYLIKRVKPDRLLEPILDVAARPDLMGKNLLSSVKSHFQALLQSSSNGEAPVLPKLPRREREVLELLSKGCVDKEIARALGISVWTVHEYVKSIFIRLKVHTRTEAVVRYLETSSGDD